MKRLAPQSYFKWLSKYFRKALYLFGIICLVMLIIAFTEVPLGGHFYFGQYHNIADVNASFFKRNRSYYLENDSAIQCHIQPNYIIMMGSSEMLGENTLLSSYFTTYGAKLFLKSIIIIASPDDTTQNRHLYRIKKDLRLKKVNNVIPYENKDINTYWQVKNINQMINNKVCVLMINVLQLIYRNAKCFEQNQFKKTYIWALYENNLKKDLLYKTASENAPKIIEQQHQLRYQVWNYIFTNWI